jgi:hypothetical protein
VEKDVVKMAQEKEKSAIESSKSMAIQQADQLRKDQFQAQRVLSPAFCLGSESVEAVASASEDAFVISSLNCHVPLKLSSTSVKLRAFSGLAVVQRVLCNFGGNYKKSRTYPEMSSTQNPLLVKQGKEEFEEMAIKYVPTVIDIKKVNSNFNGLSWLFGLAPDSTTTDSLPNAAGQLRLLVMGEMQLVMVSATHWRQYGGSGDCTFTEACKSLSELSAEVAGQLPKECVIYSTTLKANEMIWLPAGFLIAQRCTLGPLIYGIRKSMFVASDASKSDLNALIGMMDKESKPVARLTSVVDLFP